MKYVWLILLTLALAAWVAFPRYELRVVGNAPVTFDRWTGRTYFAGVMIAPGPGDDKPSVRPVNLYQAPAPDRRATEAQVDRWIQEAQAATAH